MDSTFPPLFGLSDFTEFPRHTAPSIHSFRGAYVVVVLLVDLSNSSCVALSKARLHPRRSATLIARVSLDSLDSRVFVRW